MNSRSSSSDHRRAHLVGRLEGRGVGGRSRRVVGSDGGGVLESRACVMFAARPTSL